MAFLLVLASFHTTFLEGSGVGEVLGSATCPRTFVVGKQGYAFCRLLLLQQILSFMEVI